MYQLKNFNIINSSILILLFNLSARITMESLILIFVIPYLSKHPVGSILKICPGFNIFSPPPLLSFWSKPLFFLTCKSLLAGFISTLVYCCIFRTYNLPGTKQMLIKYLLNELKKTLISYINNRATCNLGNKNNNR